MKNLFIEQIESNEIVTQQTLDSLINKNYDCGEPIMVGDTVLFALLLSFYNEQMTTRFITLNERHFHKYEPFYIDFENKLKTPLIVLK